MKTLVIHPFDHTTQFLSKIYVGKDWTIISTNISRSALRKQIKDHDRIVMLGHGTEEGLIGFDKRFIDSRWVQQLREKEIVAIWCNADKFVEKYGLNGFYTGMIISEYEEALMYCVTTGSTDIDESNRIFADAIHEAIDHPNMLSKAQDMYVAGSIGNNVIDFNKSNLYERS